MYPTFLQVAAIKQITDAMIPEELWFQLWCPSRSGNDDAYVANEFQDLWTHMCNKIKPSL